MSTRGATVAEKNGGKSALINALASAGAACLSAGVVGIMVHIYTDPTEADIRLIVRDELTHRLREGKFQKLDILWDSRTEVDILRAAVKRLEQDSRQAADQE